MFHGNPAGQREVVPYSAHQRAKAREDAGSPGHTPGCAQGTGTEESMMLNGVSGMVGETAVVTKELSGPHQPGSVLARGEEWFARSMFPGTRIAPGTTVVVADIERGLLVCYPSDDV